MYKEDTIIYYEPAKELHVIGDYDVIVAGGGAAGCAAALYAARYGARVLLVEKDGYLGGATVSQLVTAILSTNGVDFQGVWHEFMHEMLKRGGVHALVGSPGQYRGGLDAEIVKHSWEYLLRKEDVSLLYHALVAGTIIEEGKIKGLIVQTKAGRMVIFAKRVVDCTGDGMVCALAGVKWEQGDGKNIHAMACTKMLRMGNVHRPEKYSTEVLKTIDNKLKLSLKMGEYDSPVVANGNAAAYATADFTRDYLPEYRYESLNVASRVLKVNPLDPFDMTRAEIEGRAQAWQVADFVRKYIPGYEYSYLVDTSAHIGVRSSRRIKGISTVTSCDVWEFKKYEDGIAKGSWDIDIWPADDYDKETVERENPEYMRRIEKMKKGDYYDIRYGCIVVQGVDNLLVAGRCISSDHIAQSSLRIQQTCMSTGQAAGTAAALSLNEDRTPRELDTLKVISALQRDRRSVEPAFDILMSI